MLLGGILIIVGVVFFLQYLGIVPENTWGLIWPLILIVIGLSILIRHTTRR